MSLELSNITNDITLKNSIFKIGHVISVEGLVVKIKVDKQKNSSHLLYKGELLKNVSVGGYIKIVKGFTSIIAKIGGESIKEEKHYNLEYNKEEDKIDRILVVQLLGFIENNKFERGLKELPLIDNQCFLLDKDEFSKVHDFVKHEDKSIRIGTLVLEKGQEVNIGVNSLFASHIGIFGNTGSGKSYTLAHIYRKLFLEFQNQSNFKRNAKFLLFDFNGEYNGNDCIITKKTVYNLTTKDREVNENEKLIFSVKDILNVDLLSILASATEKTQQPFLKRSVNFYIEINKSNDPLVYFKNVLRNRLKDILLLPDKIKADLLLEYIRNILPEDIDERGIEKILMDDILWHGYNKGYYIKDPQSYIFNQDKNGREIIEKTKIYKHIDKYNFSDNVITNVIHFMYLQLIYDVINNRAQNEHIAPAINKLKSIQKDIDKVLKISNEENDFWKSNFFAIINLNDTNLNMKKLLPLLISHKLYTEHKNKKEKEPKESLNIIIDEAHNILSYTSQRESESWKDYRLETFEEIIKEGRKFGVFLTIASQRPSDISPTILSQLHNYYIHRLINEKDLEAVGRTISYLDKVSQDALSILPTGACVFAGLSAHIPVIVQIDEFTEKKYEPDNKTIDLLKNWLDDENGKEVEGKGKEIVEVEVIENNQDGEISDQNILSLSILTSTILNTTTSVPDYDLPF